MKIFRCTVAPWRYPVTLAMAIILTLTATAHAATQKPFWQSGDQFVTLAPQDPLPGATAEPNDHPVNLTRDRIASILASLEIRTADKDKAEALFTPSSVQTIAPHLLQGLLQASPAEDVVFAVIGLHNTLYGLAKAPKVTTGRVFYKDGRLNIIIGLAQQEVSDRDDRRLFPFTPGSRQKALQGEWKILPQLDQKGYSLTRKDWVAFSDEWRTPVAEQNLPATPGAPAQPAMRSNDTRTPAERLTTLKELSEKGLISAEEYQKKRAQILDDL